MSLLELLIAQIKKPFQATAKSKEEQAPKEESQEKKASGSYKIPPPKIEIISSMQMHALIQLSIISAMAEYETSALALTISKKMNLPEPIYKKHQDRLQSAASKWVFLTGDILIDELLKDLKISKP